MRSKKAWPVAKRGIPGTKAGRTVCRFIFEVQRSSRRSQIHLQHHPAQGRRLLKGQIQRLDTGRVQSLDRLQSQDKTFSTICSTPALDDRLGMINPAQQFQRLAIYRARQIVFALSNLWMMRKRLLVAGDVRL